MQWLRTDVLQVYNTSGEENVELTVTDNCNVLGRSIDGPIYMSECDSFQHVEETQIHMEI